MIASLAFSIRLILFLKRRDEPLVVPSLPAESINTGAASGATRAPRMFPIKQLLSTLIPRTSAPIQITLWAVVTFTPAFTPTAVLATPLVFPPSARCPTAVLLKPSVLATSARGPVAVFWLPVVFWLSASKPVAVLKFPSMLFKRAATPTAVLSEPWSLDKSAAVPTAVLLLS